MLGWGKEGAVHRLVKISTGDHFKEKDTHLQACLLQGAGLLEEGSGEPLLGLAIYSDAPLTSRDFTTSSTSFVRSQGSRAVFPL